jgi:hypothetical protein
MRKRPRHPLLHVECYVVLEVAGIFTSFELAFPEVRTTNGSKCCILAVLTYRRTKYPPAWLCLSNFGPLR